mgnify:CR=1 FL=1|jgi:cysteine desulfurase / selenocysteine lyase
MLPLPDIADNPIPTIYLDNAATSFPKPEAVYADVDAWTRRGGIAFGRGSHSAGNEAAQMVTVCRSRLAQLLNAESSDRIAFTFNCTDGLNLLLRGILRSGDRVITTDLEHNSVLRPLQQLQSELNLDVVRVGFDRATGIVNEAAINNELSKAATRLVVLNHASNVTGVIQPAKSIAAAAQSAGALCLLDAAQTIGHLPVDLQDIGADLMATAGHKGLLGPLGTGLIYVRAGLDAELRPIRCGGTGTVSELLSQPETMPSKLESGNMNMPGLAGLNAAVQWLLQHDIAVLHDQVTTRVLELHQKLSAISGITTYSNPAETSNAGIISFTINGVDSHEAATILDQSFGIQCRAGLHCAPLVHETLGTLASGGTIRFSPGPFTTDEHIAATVQAVQQIARAFSPAS